MRQEYAGAVMRLDFISAGYEALPNDCPKYQELVQQILDHFRGFDLSKRKSSASSAIQSHLREVLLKEGWLERQLISRDALNDLSNAAYRVNFFYLVQDCSCENNHRFYLHLCFDNRQAVGTNLLRFELAQKKLSDGAKQRHTYLAFVIDTYAKEKYGWDNSAGTYEEYRHALESAYKGILSPRVDYFVIRA
jgi:hypothetical protein